jgi:hypothetical protein
MAILRTTSCNYHPGYKKSESCKDVDSLKRRANLDGLYYCDRHYQQVLDNRDWLFAYMETRKRAGKANLFPPQRVKCS